MFVWRGVAQVGRGGGGGGGGGAWGSVGSATAVSPPTFSATTGASSGLLKEKEGISAAGGGSLYSITGWASAGCKVGVGASAAAASGTGADAGATWQPASKSSKTAVAP
ncbi:MAG: hypothetical protein IPJ90_18810 [Anaerolineaceae bacterium]|nr:hypothetical protein [Anaerolineaceae bacterium]